MRIVAGEHRSRRLVAPQGDGTRPTSDRARESLFAMLGDAVRGTACLDLFAGSGALGLEAISRGASSCTFVEHGRAALEALRRNVDALEVGPRSRVVARDARAALAAEVAGGRQYGLVLVDPPYAALQSFTTALDRHLHSLVPPGGRVVVESAAAEAVRVDGFAVVRERRVGAARLSILAPVGDGEPA